MLLEITLDDLIYHINIIHSITGSVVGRDEELGHRDILELRADSLHQICLEHRTCVHCASSP